MDLDELTRQKKLQSLSRKPAQEDSDIENSEANDAQLAEADSVIENPPINVEATVPTQTKQEPKQEPKQESESSSIDSSTARTIGRLAAGATPTLFALLSHNSTSRIIRANALAETQKQYAAGKPSKLVPIVGPSGEAIYETPEGAVFEKVYQKQAAKGGSAKPEYKTYYDTQTKTPVYAAIDVLGNVTSPGSNQNLNEHIKSGRLIPAVETTEFDKIKEASGREISAPREKFGTPNQGAKTMTTTSASQYGLSEGDFSKGNDLIKTSLARKAKVDDQNAMIDKANSLLNAGTTESIVQAAGVFKTAKIVTEEKISDIERADVTQEAGLLSRLADRLQTNITGEQRQSIINQMKTILKKIRDVNEQSKESIADEAVSTFTSSAYDKRDRENKLRFISSQLKPTLTSKKNDSWKLKYKK